MSYKGAFGCEKCPKSNDPAADRACPAWWETVWQDENGNVKVEKGCGWTQLQRYQLEVLKASNRPAASMDKVANEMRSGFQKLIGIFGGKSSPSQLPSPNSSERSPNTVLTRQSVQVPE